MLLISFFCEARRKKAGFFWGLPPAIFQKTVAIFPPGKRFRSWARTFSDAEHQRPSSYWGQGQSLHYPGGGFSEISYLGAGPRFFQSLESSVAFFSHHCLTKARWGVSASPNWLILITLRYFVWWRNHWILQCPVSFSFTDSSGTVSGLGPCFGDDAACNGANGGGACIVYNGFGQCECNAGFSGTHCETGLPFASILPECPREFFWCFIRPFSGSQHPLNSSK